MRLTQDKTLARNLRLLACCSKIEAIRLRAIDNETKKYIAYLQSNKGRAFVTHLANVYTKDFESRGLAVPVLGSVEELLNYLPKKNLTIPKMFEKDYARHRDVFEHKNELKDLGYQLEEHKYLQDLAKRSTENTIELNEFLNDPERSENFQHFARFTQRHSPVTINFEFMRRSIDVARKNNLYTKNFNANLRKTLPKPTLGLCRDMIGRTFTSAVKLIPAAALSAALLLGTNAFLDKDVPTPSIPGTPSGITAPYIEGTSIPGTNVDFVEPFTPPISETGELNSYASACRDFFDKTEEVYKYQTGKDINLDGLGQENIGTSTDATVYKVVFNGQTYRFSTQSPFATNKKYLKEALQAIGATVSTETSDLTYIHDGDTSLAIVDAAGNPIRSGSVMVPSHGSGQMFNQQYVKNAKKMLEAQGFDISNMSEKELIGRYLVSDQYNAQNPELSEALAFTAPLTRTIKNSFFTRDGQEDPYAIYLYNEASKQFEQKFNQAALEAEQTQSTEQSDNSTYGATLLNNTKNNDDGFEIG